jgi:magnesium chelatase subunit I
MSTRRSALLDLLDHYSVQRVTDVPEPDLGLAENRPMPFMSIVGQSEMRTALLLAIINPSIGGVLLIGPRGTGKTTAVRSLTTLLPFMEVSDCAEDALPGLLDAMSPEDARALFPDCYERFVAGESISHYEAVRLVELPLNASLDDVLGSVNQRALQGGGHLEIERGILSRADRHLLYIDEVNLLHDDVADAILDASSQGSYTVRRGAIAGTYRSRFVLIGSMNPEEGRLRPQIMDRFGLRVNVQGLSDPSQRLEVYHRVRQYRKNPAHFIYEWEAVTAEVQEEIRLAQQLLETTQIPEGLLALGMQLVIELGIESHRADHTLFEAARARAAADSREEVSLADLRFVAPMALRQRQSDFIQGFFERQQLDDERIAQALEALASP